MNQAHITGIWKWSYEGDDSELLASASRIESFISALLVDPSAVVKRDPEDYGAGLILQTWDIETQAKIGDLFDPSTYLFQKVQNEISKGYRRSYFQGITTSKLIEDYELRPHRGL